MKTVWAVCHIDKKLYSRIREDLDKYGYDDLKVYVPKISLLKKRHKGKDIYEDVPILFSYGFIRMSVEQANSRQFLNKLKKKIPGIHSWVKSLDSLYKSRKRTRIDNADDWDDFSVVSVVSKKEIRKFRKIEKENKVFSNEEISSISIGSYLVLRGYPFEGVEGKVLDLSFSQKKVTLLLYPEKGNIEVKLPFENVLYSVYHDYDPDHLHYLHNEDNPNDSDNRLFNNQEEYE